MSSFTIKDLENLTGIKAHTIRIWEQRYHFLKPLRTQTNIRFYSNEELRKILNISLLNKYGYRISQIDKMAEEEINTKILQLNSSDSIQERIIHELISMMIDMDIDAFEFRIDEQIRQTGIEKAISQIIFPFMDRIGVLWMAGHIHPAQEHLVSNIVKQKILVATDLVNPPIKQHKTALLFLPTGEFHDLSLIHVQYLFKKRGFGVLYLGVNVPLSDVEYVVGQKNPDFLYTHLTNISQGLHFDRLITQTSKNLSHIPLIISGRISSQHTKQVPKNIILKKSFSEVIDCPMNWQIPRNPLNISAFLSLFPRKGVEFRRSGYKNCNAKTDVDFIHK